MSIMGTASAAPVTGAVIIPEEAAPRPTVSIVGNVVVDKNKPTGFYELSLRVKTARTIVTNDANKTPVDEKTYTEAIEANPDNAQNYIVTNYPFQSAAAAVWINLDALTAVTWGTGKPIYSTWKANEYIPDSADGDKTELNNKYPRGIELTNEDQPKIFGNLDQEKLEQLASGEIGFVRLDTAHPDEMTNATALIEKVQGNYALLTLTANTTTTKNVVYGTETPVVVVRFAYDMNRFTKLDVGDTKADPVEPNESSFWVGLDRDANHADGPKTGQTALTWLGAGQPTMGDDRYAESDKAAANSSALQSVWYAQNMHNDDVQQEPTHFYYYLGADGAAGPATQGPPQSYQVVDGALKTPSLIVPRTEGKAVLAKKDPENPRPHDPEMDTDAEYSFFQNLLENGETLKIYAENAPTYRKPIGGGGTTILFYDWDDSLIGSLVVDKGDVRAEVNEYVETNLVHPDLRASNLLKNGKVPEEGDANRGEYANLVNSLARDYTYRGKYAYTVGDEDNVGPDGDTENKARTNGEDYPLTNKLDYAFYRHVNRIVEQEDADGAKTNYYSTSSLLAENNLDAAQYPYVYGWAVVEDTSAKNKTGWKVMYDAAKTQDVWTTIGVGELSTVKPNADGTPFPGGDPAIEDVTEPGFIAYETAKALKKGETVAAPTDYQYTTADTAANKYFRFADFSDIDAELSRYKKSDGSNKDTLVVKAVYEPGPELLSGYNYRMIKEPYYNKLSDKSASEGGAYSVEVTIERASEEQGDLRGVSRVREPKVRQDTTVDQRWIVEEGLGIDHNLSNPSFSIAAGKTETTFTRVDIDNGEMIKISMSFSPRQNKVDYYLVETYAYNFVSGGQRSETNYNKIGTAFAIDNYNYFVSGESNEKDDYFDAKTFAERNGSHGFVLYGTLNNLMQYATQYKRGESAESVFNLYVAYRNMQDANLCTDSMGTPPSFATQATMRTKILQAADDILKYHRGDPDFWNSELNCAELTYHQLQWYIIDGILRDRETADGLKLSFCHLHASCADLVSNKPKTWDDVIEAAAQGDADRLKQLSFDELKDLTHLRANANGGDFANVNVMINRLINAVNGDATMTDWVDVQKALLNGTGSVDTYWWYDGSTSNTAPGNWNALLDRAAPALTPQTYPDGVSRTTKSKLDSARSLFEANAAAGQNKATRQWIAVTDNLVAAHREEQATVEVNGEEMKEWRYTYTPLTDFDDFKTKLVETMSEADAFGVGYPSWEAVQYHLLFPDETLDFINEPWGNVQLLNTDGWDPDVTPPPKQWPEGFWWRSGNVPLTVDSVYTLLEAMKMLNGEDTDAQKRATEALKTVTWERLEGSGFWLRSSKTGEKWTEAPEPDNKTGSLTSAEWQMFKDAQKNGAYNWNTLQYYLIHKDDPDVDDVTSILANRDLVARESAYYWWRNGGTGTAVDFSYVASIEDAIAPLFEASIRAGEFGDPAAAGSVTAQMDESSFYKLTHLTKSDLATTQSAQTLDDLAWFTDTDDLLDKMNEMMRFMQGENGIENPYQQPLINWYQAQYWLLTGNWLEYGTKEYEQAVKDYWWYELTQKPEEKPPAPDPTLAVLVFMDEYASGAQKAVNVTKDEWDPMNIIVPNTDGTKGTKAASLVQAKTNLKKLVDDAKKDPAYYSGGKLNITWAQIQYYFSTVLSSTKKGLLVSDADAWAALAAKGWTADDVPEGVVIPDGVF